MKSPLAVFPVLVASASLGIGPTAGAQTPVFTQTMMPGGGTLRQSSFWVDPSGENDLDSDAQAWEDFTLTQTADVSRVRWSGEAPPPLGFEVSFWNQDPNTIALQPHLFGDGSGPIAVEIFPTPSAQSVGAGRYEFTVDLSAPITFEADTRYFVSVVGLTPVPFATWSWAQAQSAGSTFWWSRGAHMYFTLPDNRALELSGEVQACAGDLNGNGMVDFADILAALAAWGPCAGCPADIDGSGDVGFSDLLALIGLWGGCP